MTSYDTIILGSSPNALTAACYLARSGKRVLVLEPTEHLGGAFSTSEFAKGFKGDTSLTSGRLDNEIINEFKLKEHGLEVIERETLTNLLPDGKSFTLPCDRKSAAKLIGSLSSKDSERYESFMQLLDLASDFLQSAYMMAPPENHPPAEADIEKMSTLVGRLRGYGRREMTEVMRLLVMSARDLLDEWFESEPLKGLLGTLSVRGLNQGPFAGSTTFNLLHHTAVGDGYFPSTARGGIGEISKALAGAAQSFGAEIRSATGPLKVIVKDGTATGVAIAGTASGARSGGAFQGGNDTALDSAYGGESFDASVIISDYDARYTFSQLVPPPELEPEFNRAITHIRYNGAVARINLALSDLPQFHGVNPEALKGTLALAPSLAYLERAFDGGKYGAMSEQPYLDVTIPSLSDTTLAPAGKHVMSIWLQFAPHANNIDAETACELAIERLSEFTPNLKSLVLHSQVLMPQDYEAKFNLSEGHLYGGEINLAQAFFLRPVPGFAQYRTPIENLYMCGAATHPGGAINGLAGRNAAQQLGVQHAVLV